MSWARFARRWSKCAGMLKRNADYVGPKFADEARKIHHGETRERSIYGEATDAESEALRDEGIEFGRIPWVSKTDA